MPELDLIGLGNLVRDIAIGGFVIAEFKAKTNDFGSVGAVGALAPSLISMKWQKYPFTPSGL